MSESVLDQNKGKSSAESKAFKEVPGWLGGLVGIILFGALICTFVVPAMSSNGGKTQDSNSTYTEEVEKYDEVPEVCTDNALLKAGSKMKSIGGVMSFLDAKHDKTSSNKMVHRWKGEYKDGSEGQFSCFTTIQADGSESIDELWLDTERLL